MSIIVDPENIVELINGGDHNPYHLLFYMISNFRMIDYKNPLIYYYPKSSISLVEELLELLPENFIRHTEKKHDLYYKPFLPNESFKITRPFFPDWTLPYDYEFIREIFLGKYYNSLNKGLFIYISREDAKHRRVVNEQEVLEALIPMGFKKITMTEYNVFTQMNLFSQSDIIISPHGAGLAFMVFGSSKTTLIELNIKCPISRHYSHIAWHLEMDYYKLICKATDDNVDMIVDVQRLVNFLIAHPKLIGFKKE